jgi:hypothetical protein
MTQHVVHAITEGTTYSGSPQIWAFGNLSFSTVERGPKSASEALGYETRGRIGSFLIGVAGQLNDSIWSVQLAHLTA